MDYLNKIISTVSTVKTTVNYALPGNIVTKEYDVMTQSGTAGPGLCWRIYDGCKKTTKKAVSVWIFEKKFLDMFSSKHDRDSMFECIRYGVHQLTKIRHPKVLHIEHPLEESRDCLAFCTEPVLASLANLLGFVDNISLPLPDHLSNYSLEQLEIQHGLLEISEALRFLHFDAKILHRNICPESIILSKKTCWKLAAFDFCTSSSLKSSDLQAALYPVFHYDPLLTPFAQPVLNYFAPECLLNRNGTCDSYADIFSFGITIYAIFYAGRPLFDLKNKPENYKANISKLKSLNATALTKIPNKLKEDLTLFLNVSPELRPDANQIAKIAYLTNDENLEMLQRLESLCQLDNSQKCHFFKELHNKLDRFSNKILMTKIVAFVVEEMTSIEIIPFVLPILLYVGEKMDSVQFSNILMPVLSPVFLIQSPYQIPITLMQKISMFLSKCPADQIRNAILPMMVTALDSNMSQLQEPCLNVLPDVVHLIESQSMKNQFLPKILNLAIDITVISVKVNALVCIGKMISKLEQWMITDQIIPTLSKTSSKEPAVLMAILGIFKVCFLNKILSKDICAKHCVPFLVAHCVESSLNVNQFEAFVALVKEMLQKIEADQRLRLRQFVERDDKDDAINSSKSVGNSPDMLSNLVKTNTPTQNINSNHVTTIKSTTLSLEQKKKLAAQRDNANNSKPSSFDVLTPQKSILRSLVKNDQETFSRSDFNSNSSQFSLLASPSAAISSTSDVNNDFIKLNKTTVQTTTNAGNILVPLPPRHHGLPSNMAINTASNKCKDDWSSFLNNDNLVSTSKPRPTTTTGIQYGKNPLDDLVVFPDSKANSFNKRTVTTNKNMDGLSR